jgi:hypothetical protein
MVFLLGVPWLGFLVFSALYALIAVLTAPR